MPHLSTIYCTHKIQIQMGRRETESVFDVYIIANGGTSEPRPYKCRPSSAVHRPSLLHFFYSFGFSKIHTFEERTKNELQPHLYLKIELKCVS